MREVKELTGTDFDAFVAITALAYPGMRLFSAQDRERYKGILLEMEQDPEITFWGLFQADRLLGGMAIHDFSLRLHSARVGAGGLDMMAVDFLHKRQKVARDLTAFFLDDCRRKGYPLAMLYPFRPDFYKQMGFGYGPKLNQYRVKPASLPCGPSQAHVRLLDEADEAALLACYNRHADRTHGMIRRSSFELKRLMGRADFRYAGYVEGDQVLGYLQFGFQRGKDDNWLINDLIVRECVYESRQVLAELLTFLHSQLDQIHQVVFHLHDDGFHHLFFDPRNGSDNIMWPVYQECNVQGIGLMYRLVDVPGVFRALQGHNFGGQSCRLEIVLRDSFLPHNDGRTVVHFEDGRPHLKEGGAFDVSITLDVAEFSSLLLGVINFERLYRYGLAEISDVQRLGVVDALFRVWEKPVCTTVF
ncbi:MAG: GNAT family N-acetyltransferase [Chloroflexota bacterium]